MSHQLLVHDVTGFQFHASQQLTTPEGVPIFSTSLQIASTQGPVLLTLFSQQALVAPAQPPADPTPTSQEKLNVTDLPQG